MKIQAETMVYKCLFAGKLIEQYELRLKEKDEQIALLKNLLEKK
jgi:hypothetical protein